jgi:RND family efflux transporter MFP subunit
MNVCRCVLLSTVCLVALLSACGRKEGSHTANKTFAAPKSVSTAHAEMRPMSRSLTVTGTLAPHDQSILGAKVSGRLKELNVDVGSVVKAGQVLAQVEPRDYELALQQAEGALAQARVSLGLPGTGETDEVQLEKVSTVQQAKAVLEEATKNRDRVMNLAKSGIASPSEVDTIEATFKVASTRYEVALEEARTRVASLAQRRAEFEIARKRLNDSSVRSPFDGVVQSRLANLGEFIGSGTPVVQVVKIDPLRLRLEVPERQSLLVRAGQSVLLMIEGDTNTYSGRIGRLSPALDEQSRILRVEADVPAQGGLRPGLFARAEIVINENEPTLTVPTNALISFAGVEKVIAVEAGKAVEKVVTTGRVQGELIEILTGLAVNDQIILSPGVLRTGQPVVPMAERAEDTALHHPGESGQ